MLAFSKLTDGKKEINICGVNCPVVIENKSNHIFVLFVKDVHQYILDV
jgi:hypothetical protein